MRCKRRSFGNKLCWSLRFNENTAIADINLNGVIDLEDVYILAKQITKTCRILYIA
ncbi:MAG: hypothetical protein QW101_01125 [Ignisphaera sp.]